MEFNIIANEEIIETVTVDNDKYLDEYITENYRSYGVNAIFKEVKEE